MRGRGRRRAGRWCGRPRGVVRPEVLILAGNAYLGDAVPALAEPGDAVLDADHRDRAARRARAGAAADRRLRGGRALRARLLPALRRRAAALRRRHGLRRHRPGGHPRQADAEPRARSFPQLDGRARSTSPGRATARSPSAACRSSGGSGRAPTSRRATAGHGVVGSHLFGRILAEAVHGDRSRFDVFAAVPWIPFPGGRRLAVPYSVLGSWWYGLRDRLGV